MREKICEREECRLLREPVRKLLLLPAFFAFCTAVITLQVIFNPPICYREAGDAN